MKTSNKAVWKNLAFCMNQLEELPPEEAEEALFFMATTVISSIARERGKDFAIGFMNAAVHSQPESVGLQQSDSANGSKVVRGNSSAVDPEGLA